MDIKKKIGLILAFRSTNFGCQLQAFATQQVIDSLGFESFILEFKRKWFDTSSIIFAQGLFQYLIYSRIERRIRKKTRDNITNDVFKKNRLGRKEKSELFIKNQLKNVVRLYSYKTLKEKVKDFYACIIGSDQKWLPGFCYDKISTLNFTPDICKRISYATSLGVSEYPSYCKKASRFAWDKFDNISVRESKGVEIVNSICNNERCVRVLDPTYLITAEQWIDLIPLHKEIGSEYILCYFLGNDTKAKLAAREYAKKNGIKLVSIMTDESFSNVDLTFSDKLLTNVSPEKFINLIRHAKLVLTDSFHGMTFSIINNVPFYVFYRIRLDAKASRNSRIDNILEIFNLHDCLVTAESLRMKGFPVINFKAVNFTLMHEREKSLKYLKESLLLE